MSNSTADPRRHVMLLWFNQHLHAQGLITERERNQLKLAINTRYATKVKDKHLPSHRSAPDL